MSLQSVPLKTILAYHADATNETLPLSYEYCDGRVLATGTHDIGGGSSSYTLPDLRNRFLLGGDITKGAGIAGGTTNSSADAPGPKGSGGTHAKTLAIGEIPLHTHTGTTVSNGAHAHAGSTADSGGAHSHTATESTAGAHAHAGSLTNTTGAHTHTGSSMSTTGAHVHSINDPGHMHSYYNPNGNGDPNGPTSLGDLHFERNVGPITDPFVIASATTGITLNSTGDHTHALTIASDGGHAHTLTTTSDGSHSHTITVASGGAHTHSLTLVSDGAHTHTFTTDSTGGGASFDTRPRYYGVIYIMKVRN
jgi:hypothetical protein